MILAVDVAYSGDTALVAGVTFADWGASEASSAYTHPVSGVEDYESGQFYKRELPCIEGLLGLLPEPGAIVIDGYVWLDGGRPGLGGHLYRALGEAIPVIGVAKTPFRGASAIDVHRGGSRRSLFVTAAGYDPQEAASCIRSMHGEHRLPTLLKLVDHLCRGLEV